MSRRPESDICSVRGIGVADSESTSTSSRSCAQQLLLRDAEALLLVDDRRGRGPSGCTSRREQPVRADRGRRPCPRRSRRAPASPRPACGSARPSRRGPGSRDSARGTCSSAARRGSSSGTSISTCLPLTATANAARTATSVLPKPTSPQTSRSIGRGASRSSLTASIARSWSAVSRYGNAASSRSSHSSSAGRRRRPAACWRCGVEREQLARQLAHGLARRGVLSVLPAPCRPASRAPGRSPSAPM